MATDKHCHEAGGGMVRVNNYSIFCSYTCYLPLLLWSSSSLNQVLNTQNKIFKTSTENYTIHVLYVDTLLQYCTYMYINTTIMYIHVRYCMLIHTLIQQYCIYMYYNCTAFAMPCHCISFFLCFFFSCCTYLYFFCNYLLWQS